MIFSCKGNTEKKETLADDANIVENLLKKDSLDIETIKKHILLQRKIENEEVEYENSYEMTKEDLDIQMEVIYRGLKQNGFKDINDSIFSKKIQIFFGNGFNKKCLLYEKIKPDYYVYYGMLLDGKRSTLKENIFSFEMHNLFFNAKYKIFSEIMPLKNLITINPDSSFLIKIPPFLLYRNKYLFNDDRSSFEWLIKNDAFFMESLVKKFGYTGDKELLEWVIKKTHYDKNRQEDYGSLFWVKNCDGSIKIHSNTFKVLQKLYNVKTAYEILEDIKGYINYLGDEEQSKKEELTEEQRIKILANIAYFAEQYKYTDNSPYQMMGRLRYFLRDSQVDILIKNKYFNLPKFKEWWDKADYDEYYVTECEYEGSCGPGYHPLSEKEWRAQQKEE